MKIFVLSTLLFVVFNCFAVLPTSKGQESAKVPWGEKDSGLQVRIREVSESERKEGKAMMIFEVRNVSDRPVEFCWWQSPLEKRWLADSFTVTVPDGKVKYRGIMVKRSAPSKTKGDYTTLASGWTLSVKFDLNEGYGLKAGSKYSVRYEGTSLGPLLVSNLIEVEIK